MIKLPNILIFILLVFLIVPSGAGALCEGPIVPCGREGTPECSVCHLFELFNNVLEFLLTCLVPIIGVFMLVLGGFYFLFSGSSPAMMNQARSIFTAALIGIIIIFSSWVVLNTFLSTIGVAEWTGLDSGWWQINCVYNSGDDGDGGDDDDGNGGDIDDTGTPGACCGECMRWNAAGDSCNVPLKTNWGYAECACTGPNRACIMGECVTCDGKIFSDGCGGCTNQKGAEDSEFVCWREAGSGQSCSSFCSAFGGDCASGTWDDNTSCGVCRAFHPATHSANCDGSGSSGAPYTDKASNIWGETWYNCRYRESQLWVSSGALSCGAGPGSGNRRFCVCAE